MRILVLFSGRLLESRGTPSRARQLARGLAERPGVELVALSGDPPGSGERLGFEQVALAGRPPGEALAAEAESFRPHLVYGQTHKALAPMAALPNGVARVADLHGDLAAERWEQSWRPLPRRLWGWARQRLTDRRTLGTADAFTVVTRALADRVAGLGRPTRVVWGGVDPDLFRPAQASEGATGFVEVLYAGNFRPYQGVGTLVAAADVLLAGGGPFRFTLLGDPAGGDAALAAARRLPPDRVRILEPVPYERVPETLAPADVLVIPRPDSRTARFGFPSKLPEYMALGKAIVATDVGEQGRLIRDAETGLLIPPGTPAALAAALERLRDGDLRRRLGRRARAVAESELSWRATCGRLADFLDAVAAHG